MKQGKGKVKKLNVQNAYLHKCILCGTKMGWNRTKSCLKVKNNPTVGLQIPNCQFAISKVKRSYAV